MGIPCCGRPPGANWPAVLTGTKVKLAPKYFGATTPPEFETAFTSEVAGGEALVFVYFRNASGLFAAVEGGPKVVAALPAAPGRPPRAGLALRPPAAGLPAAAPGTYEWVREVAARNVAEARADRAGLEMPITNEVNAVLYDGKPAREAVTELMSRPLREEVN